jgi:hypothetical protein
MWTRFISDFLEHIFKKCALLIKCCRPSVRSSVRIFFVISAPRELQFWILAKDYVSHRLATGILDPWPRSQGIWPWLGPLPRKIRLLKYNLASFASNWIYVGTFGRSLREKNLELFCHSQCGLLLNPIKVPNSKY